MQVRHGEDEATVIKKLELKHKYQQLDTAIKTFKVRGYRGSYRVPEEILNLRVVLELSLRGACVTLSHYQSLHFVCCQTALGPLYKPPTKTGPFADLFRSDSSK